MTPDEVGKQFHNMATLGQELSPEEKARLAEWYARLDEEESRQLAPSAPPADLPALRQQVHGTLAAIITVSQKIQAITKENEVLRNDITALQQQLARKAL